MDKAIKKYLLLIFISILFQIKLFGQQDPRSTLYMYNQSSFNAGVVGSRPQGDALLDFRIPLAGYKDNSGQKIGTNTWYCVNMPISKIKSGIGLAILTEKNGIFEQTTKYTLQYAYQLSLGEGTLGIGINGNIHQLKFDFTGATYPDGLSGTGGGTDELISKLDKKSFSSLGCGAGFYYKNNDLYLGISSPDLLSSKLSYEGGDLKYFTPHVYFFAGYTYNPANPLFAILPSIQYKGSFKNMTITPQLNLNTIVEYNRFINIGLAYTTGNDISVIGGVNFKNGSKFDGFRVLGSCDIITSKLRSYSNFNCELTIGYSFNLKVEKAVKTYKSVRFL